ncbi:MAG: hypothetical protein ACLSVD_02215 [Eggerthellaceae bacterium]
MHEDTTTYRASELDLGGEDEYVVTRTRTVRRPCPTPSTLPGRRSEMFGTYELPNGEKGAPRSRS